MSATATDRTGKKAYGKTNREDGIEIDGEGHRWLSRLKAADLLGVHEKTIMEWRHSCPWLDGSGINTRNFRLGGDLFFRESQLFKICDARVNLTSAPKIPGHIHIDEVVAALDISYSAFRIRLKAIGEKTIHFDGKASNGRIRPFAYITEAAKAKLIEKPRADTISQKQAAITLGSRSIVDKAIRSGKLKYALGTRLWKAEVEHLAAARKNNQPRAGYRWEESPKEKFQWRGKAGAWLGTFLSSGPRFLSEIVIAGQKVGLGIGALRRAFVKIKGVPYYLDAIDEHDKMFGLWRVFWCLADQNKPAKEAAKRIIAAYLETNGTTAPPASTSPPANPVKRGSDQPAIGPNRTPPDSSTKPHIVHYPDLHIHVDFARHAVIKGDSETEFSGKVEWHILAVALTAHPQKYTLAELGGNYPGKFDRVARSVAKGELNKKLNDFGIQVHEYGIIKIGKNTV